MSKFFKQFVFLLLPASLALRAFGQGTFQNLDFESATLPFVSVGNPSYPFVYASNAMPGWTLYLGTNQTQQALYNDEFGATVAVELIGPGWTNGGIIDGSYTAVLQAGESEGVNGGYSSASIAQTGLIPSNVKSILISEFEGDAPAQVTVGGQNIPMVALSTNTTVPPLYGSAPCIVFGGDVSAFAGQTEQLEITAPDSPYQFTYDYIDDIQFSMASVPEPTTYALLVFGAVAFGFNHWRRKK